MLRACSRPLSMSFASTSSRIRGAVRRVSPEAMICFSTSRLIASAVGASTVVSSKRASTMRLRSQWAISSSEVRTKRLMSVVSFSATCFPLGKHDLVTAWRRAVNCGCRM